MIIIILNPEDRTICYCEISPYICKINAIVHVGKFYFLEHYGYQQNYVHMYAYNLIKIIIFSVAALLKIAYTC